MGFAVESHNARMLGSGEKVVVLGHGFGSDQSVWKHMVPHLVDHYRVILYDNMGAGTTNPDYFDFDRYASLEGFSSDLIAILEEFEVEKCIYLGHSLSSMTGAIASIFRPDLFHKLISFAGSPRFINTEDYYGGFEREEVDQLCTAMETNYTSWASGFAPLVVGGDMESAAVQEFSRTLFSMRPDIALSVLRMVFNFDLRHLLGRVSVPCHIVQSSKDMAVPLAVAEYLHQSLGGKSIVEVVATEGHIPQLSAPEIAIPVLLRHIEYDIADDS